MTLQHLPTETILQILCFVTPRDIVNLQLVSRRLSGIIKHNEHSIYTTVIRARGLEDCRPLTSATLSKTCTQSLQEVRILSMQWDRRQLVERLLPAFSEKKSPREGLEILWDYQTALQHDFQDCAVDGHHAFIKSTTMEELNLLMTAMRDCGDSISRALVLSRYGSRRMEWYDEPCAFVRRNKWDVDAFCEVVLAKGFQFVVNAVIERSHKALDEMKDWKRPTGKTLISRLYDELRWKSKICSLQANARC